MTKPSLEARAEAAASLVLDQADDGEGTGVPSVDAIAEAMITLARDFARDAILHMSGPVKQTPLSRLWNAQTIHFTSTDGLFGIGFGSKDDAEAWREKSIAHSIAAAESGGE